ncbi:MAG: hypothetical protein ACK480_15675, partial [Planctomycetota bacterium]
MTFWILVESAEVLGLGSAARAEAEKKAISIASKKPTSPGTVPAKFANRFALGTDPAALGARHLCCGRWDLLAKRFAMGTDPKRNVAEAKKLANLEGGNSECG